ncbi:hypothetical protein AVEN_59131-1, partial [Araneus ventricosus]
MQWSIDSGCSVKAYGKSSRRFARYSGKQVEGTEGSGTSPGVYLRDDPIFGAQLINQSELRAPTAEKAAYLLDAALAARSR